MPSRPGVNSGPTQTFPTPAFSCYLFKNQSQSSPGPGADPAGADLTAVPTLPQAGLGELWGFAGTCGHSGLGAVLLSKYGLDTVSLFLLLLLLNSFIQKVFIECLLCTSS